MATHSHTPTSPVRIYQRTQGSVTAAALHASPQRGKFQLRHAGRNPNAVPRPQEQHHHRRSEIPVRYYMTGPQTSKRNPHIFCSQPQAAHTQRDKQMPDGILRNQVLYVARRKWCGVAEFDCARIARHQQ
ncbi:Hypothetical predicted protein [Pelobates cultripes]|uniref:Uncharacterized protein n=1 Tax=Pelobates cultripes TaxID=61616 RepID=A0AAD1SNW4_PELCU|nr:Hypothetical predicted protein [Pelobates cultripes]